MSACATLFAHRVAHAVSSGITDEHVLFAYGMVFMNFLDVGVAMLQVSMGLACTAIKATPST
jgi:hypothetical protein